MQFTRAQLEDQLQRLSPLIGRIDRAEYSHHKFLGNQDSGNLYELNYVLQVSGGTFKLGDMKVTVVDRGDHPGLFGVFLNGRS